MIRIKCGREFMFRPVYVLNFNVQILYLENLLMNLISKLFI